MNMKNLVLVFFAAIMILSCAKEDETITQLVKFTVKPAFNQQFKKAAVNSLNLSLEEEGNVTMKLYSDDNNPNVLYVYSIWKNKEAHTIHGEKSYTKELQGIAKKSLASKPEIMILGNTKPFPVASKELNIEDNEETLFFIFKVKDGYRDQVIKQFEKHITHTRTEKGNLFFDLYTVEGDKNTFVVYENWRNASAIWDIHMKQPYAEETGALLNKAIIGKLEAGMNFVSELNDEVLNTTYALEKQWEVSGFSMPESVFASPNHPWLYVSNVNMKGKVGYLSKLDKNGKVIAEKWIDGLAGPTGSDMFQGKLYVSDQKYLRIIDVEKGIIERTIKSETAISLNDVSISKNGQVFISDVPGGKIYTLKNNELVVWLESPEIHHPNGVLVDGDHLMVVDFGSEMNPQSPTDVPGSVYKVNISNKSVELVSTGEKLGKLDGVVKQDNGFLVSAPFTKEIHFVDNNNRYLIEESPFGAADINSDGENLYLPYIFGNKVASYKIVKEVWHRITTKEEYLEKCADVYYGEKAGKSVATKEGLISGNFGGKELKGTWDWNGKYFSRTSTIGDIDLGHDDLVIEVTPTKMRLTLQKGDGISVVYEKK
jgi:quinol monooxygenase YgiN